MIESQDVVSESCLFSSFREVRKLMRIKPELKNRTWKHVCVSCIRKPQKMFKKTTKKYKNVKKRKKYMWRKPELLKNRTWKHVCYYVSCIKKHERHLKKCLNQKKDQQNDWKNNQKKDQKKRPKDWLKE